MNRWDEWELITRQLQENALKDYRSTREYELSKIRQEHLDDIMSSELTTEQRRSIEEILFEIISFHDRKADLLYRQGMRDSVSILKTLGALS